MRIGTWLFFLFLAVPVTEILLFIFVGQRIGVWPTVGLVVLTAVLGSMLVSRQGRGTWNNFQREIASGQSPTTSIVHGAMILVAGALLLTPGFLTDIVGFTLLVPQAREGLREWFVKRMVSRWVVIS
ncbi:MAG: FxsA family protein [Actinomycetota bacterium]|nr:FxsA family protein [Actinomycetota bacterium]